MVRPSWSGRLLAVRVARGADLDVSEPDLRQGIHEGLLHVPEPARESFDQCSERVDREAGLVQLRGLNRKVECRELEQAVSVIGHHDLDGSVEKLLADLVNLGLVDTGWLVVALRRDLIPTACRV